MAEGPVEISIDTLVALETTDPFVLLRIHLKQSNELVAANQMTPEEARELGLWLIEAAEASEQDANLVKVMRSLKASEDYIQYFILQVRDRRSTSHLEKEEPDESIPSL